MIIEQTKSQVCHVCGRHRKRSYWIRPFVCQCLSKASPHSALSEHLMLIWRCATLTWDGIFYMPRKCATIELCPFPLSSPPSLLSTWPFQYSVLQRSSKAEQYFRQQMCPLLTLSAHAPLLSIYDRELDVLVLLTVTLSILRQETFGSEISHLRSL